MLTSVHLMARSPLIFVHAVALGQKLQIKLGMSPSHSILTQGQSVLALTQLSQALGMVAQTTELHTDMPRQPRREASVSLLLYS